MDTNTNINNNEDDDDDRLYYEGLIAEEERTSTDVLKLPAVVEKYVESAVEVSKYNNVPAAISYFCLLGELSKNMVQITGGRRKDDTRIHFLWMQTSGTGKSEMYNFFGPVAKLTFEMINATYADSLENPFDIFAVKETTDAALIGSIDMQDTMVEQENGPPRREKVPVVLKGALEGSGLCVYDEFEYSGVFNQSQHKENVVMYLNTFMNSIHGENQIISKKLKDGGVIECNCQRGIYATTYIPKDLTKVIAEKGVMQRMLIYIWEVPQEIQDEIREGIISEVGTYIDSEKPIKQYANSLLIIYDLLKKRYEEVNYDAKKTITFSPEYRNALRNEWLAMKNYVSNSRPEVLEIAGNFITRLLGTLTRLSVLCAIAEAPSISDERKRYVVSAKNVRQASSLVRQCYKSLVSWLDSALRVKRQSLEQKSGADDFKNAYLSIKNTQKDEWVNKTILFGEVRRQTNKGDSTIYKHFQKIGHQFEKKKIGHKSYVKLKEEK